jgi:hypothetical protein
VNVKKQTYTEVLGRLISRPIDFIGVSHRDKHRKKFSDVEWAEKQPKGKPNYHVGDVVEFKVGGFGIIDEVSKPHAGWPSSYSTAEIEGMRPHKDRMCAWHYEGDFKRLVRGSALRRLRKK